MSSFGPSSRARRLALAAGGALALALSSAPSASAQFTIDPCSGAAAPGQGATFQNSAFTGFKAIFQQEAPAGCGAAGNFVTYTGSGSGAGRGALGERGTNNPTGARHVSDRWAGADEAPSDTQRAQIEAGPLDANGQDATVADNNKLHVVPVAIGSIAVIVNLPSGCDSFGTAQLERERPRVTLDALEDAWYSAPPVTWGELMPGLPAGATCAGQTVKRIVRQDSSGTTFAFKQLMARIDPAHTLWRSLGNTLWPNSPGPNPVQPAPAAGGGSLATTVATTAGGGTIGYADLATARAATAGGGFTYAAGQFDRTFWVPLQRTTGSATYDDPQSDPDGYKNTANAALRGSSCSNAAPATFPTSSYGDWSQVDSTMTGNAYAACTLTYDLMFDDNAVVYCNSAEEQAKARTIKDYFERAVVSDAGQNSLASRDYARLPAGILTVSRAAIASVGWNKGGQGRPCSNEPPTPQPTATPTPVPPGGGGGGTPPPAAPSNNVTISSARVSGTTIRLSLQLPGAGKVAIASTTKPKKGKTIKLANKNVTITKAGAQTVTVSLSSKAKSALRKDKKLKIAMKVTFTPNGGTAKTVSRNVTVKQPKKKSKS